MLRKVREKVACWNTHCDSKGGVERERDWRAHVLTPSSPGTDVLTKDFLTKHLSLISTIMDDATMNVTQPIYDVATGTYVDRVFNFQVRRCT